MDDSDKLKPPGEDPGQEPVTVGKLTAAASLDKAQQEADHARRLLESGLFDPVWYAANHPEVAASELPPVIHYLRVGAAKGFPPSPKFDGADYLSRYPDIGRSGINPLVHFVSFGQKEGRKANPVNPEDVNARLLAESGLFDEVWYREAYPEVAESEITPVHYFLRHGREKGHNPSNSFDAADYVARYADIASTKINPLLHYLRFGRTENRSFRPVPTETAEKAFQSQESALAAAELQRQPRTLADPGDGGKDARIEFVAGSGLFDAGWYTARYPEVGESGLDPLLHYLHRGWVKGFAPSPGFDGTDYLFRYKDVKAAGVNPLVHYLTTGQKEGRKITPADRDEMITRMIDQSGLFDQAWYLATYPDAARPGQSPIKHFRKHGRKKALNPGPQFDSALYIAEHMEDAPGTMNPLVHYLTIGRARSYDIHPVQPAAAAEPVKAKRVRRPSARRSTPKSSAAVPAVLKEVPVPTTVAPPSVAPTPVVPPAVSIEPVVAPEDVALIEASPLFDKAWYLAKYTDVAKLGMNAAEHFLRYGAREMRLPSVFFDTEYYSKVQCPEIQQAGINPLVHFLKTGRTQGLKPHALLEAAGSVGPGRPLSPGAWPLAATGDRPEPEPGWLHLTELTASPPEDLLFAGHTLLAGAVKPAILTDAADRLAAFRKLCGLAGNADLRIGRGGPNAALANAIFAPDAYTGLDQHFRSGPAKLADAWHASSGTLRLRLGEDGAPPGDRLVIRAYQCAANGTEVQLAGEAMLMPSAPSFVDLALADPFMPVLLVLSDPGGAAQAIGLLPFPSLCRGGLHYAELVGREQLTDPMGQLLTLSDSLVRALMDDGHTFLLHRISVSLKGATGNEPPFATSLAAWLSRVFGLSLRPGPELADETPGEKYLRSSLLAQPEPSHYRRNGTHTLVLPHDAIPALSALAAPAVSGTRTVTGGFLVVDEASLRPRLAVNLPDNMPDLLELQPSWAPQAFPLIGAVDTVAPASTRPDPLPPLAIRFAPPPATHRAAMLMPLAPDAGLPAIGRHLSTGAGRMDVVIRSTGTPRLDNLLASLLAQEGVSLARVKVEASGKPDVETIRDCLEMSFPGRSEVVAVSRHQPVSASLFAGGSDASHTLLVDGNVVLHDPRTLAALLTAVRSGRTASAACVVLREMTAGRGTSISFESGGYFPSHISLLGAPRLILSLPDVHGALPHAVYPVIANDTVVMVLDNAALTACGDIASGTAAPGSGLEFSLKALALGYRHLCISAVRAACIGNPPPCEIADPPGIANLNPGIWQSILETITVLRDLH